MIVTVILFVVFLIAIIAIRNSKKLDKSPPGPICLPVLGYFPFLGSSPVNTVLDLCNEYGDIMKISILGEDYYYLNSIETVNEAFVSQASHVADRPGDEFNVFTFVLGKNAVANAGGDHWKFHKSFIMRSFTESGMGKSEIEPRIHEVCDILVNDIHKTNGRPHEFHDLLSHYALNIISAMILSKYFDSNDPNYLRITHLSHKFFACQTHLNGVLAGPVFHLYYRMFHPNIYQQMKIVKQELLDFCVSLVNERISEPDSGDKQDLLSGYIDEMNGVNGQFCDLETIARNIANMFIAGIDTASTTLYFAVNYMALYPSVQEEVHNEIEDLIGSDRPVSLKDRQRMHVTQAVMAEIQRHSCIVPVGLIRVNAKEITVGGYKIPKRSYLIANLLRLSRDKRYFANPDAFDPKHFIDANGHYVKNEANVAFSVGSRKCLGIKLAEDEFFIAFVTLMQRFKWIAPEDEQLLHRPIPAVVTTLDTFHVCAVPR